MAENPIENQERRNMNRVYFRQVTYQREVICASDIKEETTPTSASGPVYGVEKENITGNIIYNVQEDFFIGGKIIGFP